VFLDLDRIDFALLRLLQKDARLSNKELAARVGLAPSSCLERVRRLLSAGVLRGFHAEVNPRPLGIGLEALVFVRLARHARNPVRSFRKHCLDLAETLTAYHVAGQFDFIVHLAVRDADHLRDLTLDAFTTRPEVGHLETHLIFEHARRHDLPILVAPSDEAGPRRAGRRQGRAPRRRAGVRTARGTLRSG
jgi:DNA-binding Lrp family transcriptional regulator